MKKEPCPFCGNNVDLGIGRSTEDREGWPTYVYCGTCGAQGPWIYTRDKAVFTCTEIACEETGLDLEIEGMDEETPLRRPAAVAVPEGGPLRRRIEEKQLTLAVAHGRPFRPYPTTRIVVINFQRS